ncbi:MAG: YceD family protein [Prevotella sp.]|jgi:uncharacterized metal-binding protein YceD (DUF177 family)|nr:DUF177 domain-containing protein [Prevotella sp.]
MDDFQIDLRDLKEGLTEMSFLLDDDFFGRLEGATLKRGRLRCDLSVNRTDTFFELKFHISGMVIVPCDLCLDDMEQPIEANETLACQLGEEDRSDDELVVVARENGVLDISWFVYEFVNLAVPIRHVHAPGKCNAAMMSILDEYSVSRRDDEDEEESADPRWDALRKLKQ